MQSQNRFIINSEKFLLVRPYVLCFLKFSEKNNFFPFSEQAELDSLGAENDVDGIELEREVVNRKGCIEETFWRFPHIAQQIFEELDNKSLSGCLEINNLWQNFINEKKILQINLLKKYTHIKSSILKKALSNKDFETVQKLASYSMKVYKKVIIEEMNHLIGPILPPHLITYEDVQEKICYYLFEKKHRDNIQHLLTELMVKDMTPFRGWLDFLDKIQPLIQNEDFELLQMMHENLKDSNRRFFMETIVDFNRREVKVFSESEANEISNSCFANMGIPQSKYPVLHWETLM